MSRKTIIIILAVVGVLCLCAVIVGIIAIGQVGNLISRTVSLDPTKASETARSITDYTLPKGYKESFSMSLMGMAMAGFSSQDESTYIWLFQAPASANLNQDQMEQQMKQLGSQQTGQSYNLQKIGTQPATIRGQSTELSIYEGTSNKGTDVREVIGVFEGKNGPAILMVVGPKNSWDEAAINSFISSMR
jgi:hypothetical protein